MPWTYQPRNAARARAACGLSYVCGQSSKHAVWSKSVQRALCCCTAHVDSASSRAELTSSHDSSTRAERAVLTVFCPSLAPQKMRFTQKRRTVVTTATGSAVLHGKDAPHCRCQATAPPSAHATDCVARSKDESVVTTVKIHKCPKIQECIQQSVTSSTSLAASVLTRHNSLMMLSRKLARRGRAVSGLKRRPRIDDICHSGYNASQWLSWAAVASRCGPGRAKQHRCRRQGAHCAHTNSELKFATYTSTTAICSSAVRGAREKGRDVPHPATKKVVLSLHLRTCALLADQTSQVHVIRCCHALLEDCERHAATGQIMRHRPRGRASREQALTSGSEQP